MKCIALLGIVISLSCTNDNSIVYTFSEIETLSETGFVNDEMYEKYKDDILVLNKETLYVLGDPLTRIICSALTGLRPNTADSALSLFLLTQQERQSLRDR
jgi:hypothetical protein